MASIRRRQLKSGLSWQVEWIGPDGQRRGKSFPTRALAAKHKAKVELETHQINEARTVRDAFDGFLDHFETLVASGDRERSTLLQYQQHARHHLEQQPESEDGKPLRHLKMHEVGTPDIQRFLDWIQKSRSVAMAGKLRTTLRVIWGFGQLRGWTDRNPVDATKVDRRKLRKAGEKKESRIPSPEVVADILQAADDLSAEDGGRLAALTYTIFFAGLRMSEWRALPRSQVSLRKPKPRLSVVQKADRWNRIGPVKSDAGLRDIPLGPATAQRLRVWMMAAPPSDLDLLFPSQTGNVFTARNFYDREWLRLMTKAEALDTEGKPLFSPHDARHFAGSVWLSQTANRPSAEQVKTLMGHSSIKTTYDIYGHLLRDLDEETALVTGAEDIVFKAKRKKN